MYRLLKLLSKITKIKSENIVKLNRKKLAMVILQKILSMLLI